MRKLFIAISIIVLTAAGTSTAAAQQTLEEATDSLKEIVQKAKAGDATAQNILGEWYYKGRHVKQDYKEAAQWWAKAAQQGNVLAIGNLGICYQTGHGVSKDTLRAIGLYNRSIKEGNTALFEQQKTLADNGSLFSQVYTGYCYQNGIGATKDKNKAAEYFVKAADKGSVDAQRELGMLYLNAGKDEEAVKWFKKGSDNGSLPCTFWYGKMLYDGKGIAKDRQGGFVYLLQAAEAGFAQGQFEVAKAYLNGEGVTKSAEQGTMWLTKAANNDVSNAQYMLATLFVSGEGVGVDYDQAVAWFAVTLPKGHRGAFKMALDSSKSGELYGTPFHAYLKGLKYYADKDFDHALEQFKIVEKAGIKEGKTMQGVVYANKDYSKYNLQKGLKALNKAAAESAMAQYLLGAIYEAGKGVDKDINQALTYLRQAADAGYTPAICYLGDMYYEGRGVEQSYYEAVRYYNKAQALLTSSSAKRLAACYENGYGGLEVDKDKAADIIKKQQGSVADLLKEVPMN